MGPESLKRLLPVGVRTWLGGLRDRLWKWRAKRSVKAKLRRGHVQHGLPGELIVSLTSHPGRFATLHKTIRSLLAQDIRADRTIVWIAENDATLLPPAVRDLARQGLEIRTCPDLGSYKKIVPALQAFPDAFIATADDDIYYPPDWLTRLVRGFVPDEKVIVCVRAHGPKIKGTGFAPYSLWHWELVTSGDVRDDLFPTGGAGALYPPGSLAAETGDIETFMEICPTADDVWLYCMAKRAGSRHRQVGGRFPIVTWAGTQKDGLANQNVFGTQNDVQLERVWKRYCADLEHR